MSTLSFEVGKTYILRNGHEVKIEEIWDASNPYPVIGKKMDEGRGSWTSKGLWVRDTETNFDIVAKKEEPEMPNLTIEAGKFYKTRCGWKARALEVFEDRHGEKTVIGYRINSGGYAWPMSWNFDGESRGKEANGYAARLGDYDLVAPWTDPPVVDWSKFPGYIVAVAMDDDGKWIAYTEVPVNDNELFWYLNEPDFDHALCMISLDNVGDEGCKIIFSGDWRDSLAVRPGWEGK